MRRLLLLPVAFLGFASAVALAKDRPVDASLTGTIAALNGSSITVRTPHREVRCRLSADGVGPVGFVVGQRADVTCQAGVLIGIAGFVIRAGADAQVSPSRSLDAIAALSATSITVDGLTCTLAAGSPSTSGFTVGEQVRMYCQNNVLTGLYANTTSTTTTTPTTPTTTNSR